MSPLTATGLCHPIRMVTISQKEFERVQVIENAAGGRLLLDEICELCQLRRIATGRHVLDILKARRARHPWDAGPAALARMLTEELLTGGQRRARPCAGGRASCFFAMVRGAAA